jgi:hypothetical protein
MAGAMETFIVRIYQRDQTDSGRLAGAVEIPGLVRPFPFNSLESLRLILCTPISNRRDDGHADEP